MRATINICINLLKTLIPTIFFSLIPYFSTPPFPQQIGLKFGPIKAKLKKKNKKSIVNSPSTVPSEGTYNAFCTVNSPYLLDLLTK